MHDYRYYYKKVQALKKETNNPSSTPSSKEGLQLPSVSLLVA